MRNDLKASFKLLALNLWSGLPQESEGQISVK